MLPFSASRRYSTSSNTAESSTTVASSARPASFCRRKPDEAAPGASLKPYAPLGARLRFVGGLSRLGRIGGSSAAELDRPDCHGDGSLRWVDHRDAERLFQRLPMACHSGATHDHRLGAVLVSQLSSDINHAPQRLFAARRLGHRHFERALASKPVGEPHLKQIALMSGNRALVDRYDTKAVCTRERGEDTAFSDAEHRPRGAFAAHVQAGIAIARDYEGVGRVVGLYQPPQRHHHAFDIGLGLDAEGTFCQGGTHDLRAVCKT